MSHHVVEFADVCYRYPDGTEALKGVSFRLKHGESVGIVGANGSGKTTLILQANGYLLPTSGQIRIGNLEISKTTRQEIRKKVGVVFQHTDDQLFMPTVFEDVAFGPLNLGMSPELVRERVSFALSTVGCQNLSKKPPHHLSSGQKRSVAIAAVLAMEPDILVMDEPSSDLDPKSRRKLIGLLQGFQHTRIIASHDLDLILDVCTRTLVIKEGRIVADGPSADLLFNEELMEENNLELPLSQQRRAGSQQPGGDRA